MIATGTGDRLPHQERKWKLYSLVRSEFPHFQPWLFFFLNIFYFFNVVSILFIYFWVFVAARRLSLVAVSGGYSSLQCVGFSLWWLLLAWALGSLASVVVACGLQ